MADALPVLEVEHELCSANLPGIPQVAESAIDQALEALHLRGTTLDSEKIQAEPEPPATSEPQPIPGNPSEPRSRKSTRPAKRPPSKHSSRLVDALRSRRLRIIATVVGVLLVVGLIGLNWQRSGLPKSSDDLAEMDLSEFQDDLHFGTTGVGRASEPRPLGEITGADAAALKIRSSRPDSGERLAPLGLVNLSEQRWPSASIQSVGGFSQPAARGSQAAWLTGQIEIESIGTPLDDSLRQSNGKVSAR